MRTILIIATVLFGFNSFSQDFIRAGVALDFKKNKVLQTFSFDLNRTEKVDEKIGSYLRYSRNDFYILPSLDINIGEGITSSENNVGVQVNIGKGFIDQSSYRWKSDTAKLTVVNQAVEFNPSYNSDKLFLERLGYGQAKYIVNIATTKHKYLPKYYLRAQHSLSAGPFLNVGYRYSSTYRIDHFYSVIGLFFEYKTQLMDLDKRETWVFKLSAKHYYIISDLEQLTNEEFAGMFKASIDRLLFSRLLLGVAYKYGNDNPTYKGIHTCEFSLKYNLKPST